MTSPTKTAWRLINDRRIVVCQVCGIRQAEEAHHCLYGRRKGVKELNDDRNLQLVCRECHKFSGKAKSFENKINFWRWACRYYGEDSMLEWHNSLPIKVKENYQNYME